MFGKKQVPVSTSPTQSSTEGYSTGFSEMTPPAGDPLRPLFVSAPEGYTGFSDPGAGSVEPDSDTAGNATDSAGDYGGGEYDSGDSGGGDMGGGGGWS